MNTAAPIIADMLQCMIYDEWSGRTNTACHCHPEYRASCPGCGAFEYGFGDDADKEHEHKPDCPRMKLMARARAFLEIENTLAEERGEDTVYVP